MFKKKRHIFQVLLMLIIWLAILVGFLLYYRNVQISREKEIADSDLNVYSESIRQTMGDAEQGFIDLIHDEKRGPIVKYGIENNVITSQGPFDLKQGGKGIAIRTPVFLEDGSFWGLSIAIIDTDQLMKATKRMIVSNGYDYLLEKSNPLDDESYQTVSEKGNMNDPVTVTFNSGASNWRLSIEPAYGWFHSHDYMIIAILSSAIVILITWLSYMLILNHDRQAALMQAANIDFLTGVLNRQGIDKMTRQYFEKNPGKRLFCGSKIRLIHLLTVQAFQSHHNHSYQYHVRVEGYALEFFCLV